MPPAAAPAAPPPDFDSPDYIPPDLAQGASSSAKNEAVQGALEHIWHKFHAGAAKQEAESRALERVLDACLATCLTVVDMQFMPREDNPVSAVSQRHNSWEAEEPPQPCSVDSWLRAAIPDIPAPQPGDALSFSMQAYLKSSQSMGSRNGSPQRGESSGATTPKGRASVPDSPLRGARAGSRSINKVANGKNGQTSEEALLEGQLRAELNQRKAAAELSRALAVKDAEERARIATLRKELKGRDYGYDHKGAVVPLSDFDPDRTPLESLSGPAYAVKLPPPPDAPRSPSPKRTAKPQGSTSGSGSADTASMTPAEKRKAQERALLNDFKKAPSKTQPSSMDIMAPCTGVTLRQGSSAKSGPQMAPDAQGMTPEAFKRYVAKQQALAEHAAQQAEHAAQQASLTGMLGSSLRGLSSTGGRSSAALGRASGSTLSGRPSRLASLPPVSYAGDEGALRGGVDAQPSGFLATFGNDYDPLKDAKPKQLAPLMPKPSTPDANLSLLTAADWGMSTGGRGYEEPAALPVIKPSGKQLQDTGVAMA